MFDDRAHAEVDTSEERVVGRSLLRGFRRTCPHCGSGPLLRGYLKLRQQCAVCGTDLSPARADDGPAYLTILIVGHLMAPFMHVFFTTFRPDPIVLATVFCTACVGLSLYLLPRIKGMIVGFQWAKRMNGF